MKLIFKIFQNNAKINKLPNLLKIYNFKYNFPKLYYKNLK